MFCFLDCAPPSIPRQPSSLIPNPPSSILNHPSPHPSRSSVNNPQALASLPTPTMPISNAGPNTLFFSMIAILALLKVKIVFLFWLVKQGRRGHRISKGMNAWVRSQAVCRVRCYRFCILSQKITFFMLIFPIKKNLPLAENGFCVAQVKMGWMSALVQHCALQGKAVCSRSSQPSSHQIMMHCSMYFRSWLIQLNRSYKYNENITRTGIST